MIDTDSGVGMIEHSSSATYLRCELGQPLVSPSGGWENLLTNQLAHLEGSAHAWHSSKHGWDADCCHKSLWGPGCAAVICTSPSVDTLLCRLLSSLRKGVWELYSDVSCAIEKEAPMGCERLDHIGLTNLFWDVSCLSFSRD